MRCLKLIFSMIPLFLAGCAGLQPITDADLTFERIVEAPGYSKEQIFNGTKIWIAENFRSAKAVLEYESKDTGTLIGNGTIPYQCSGSGLECMAWAGVEVRFTMRVDIKDQKFRLTFSNLPIRYRTQSDIDMVRSKLLKFGDQLLSSFGKDKGKSDW